MAEVLVNSPNEGDSNGCVLWLDDLERFLDPVALTPTMLAALVQRSIIVVATMQARFYRTYVAKKQLSLADDDDQKHMSRVSAQVVESFTILFLNRLWSKTELLRANEASDPRVLDAVRHGSEYGVAEYLAAGPQLLREWQSAWAVGTNPRGAAIVAAAVDCARTGVNRNLSASLIRELHHHYLRERGGRSLRPESEEEAFEWATQLRHGTTSLLTSVGSGTYRVFDYLPDAIDRDAGSEPVPDQVWLGNLNHARVNPCKCCVRAIGRAAINQQRPDIAWTAWHAEAESGDSEAAYEIGMLLEKKGDLVGAEAWYRRSSKGSNADAMHNLAFLVRDGGDEAGALDWWKRAVEAGNLHAAFHLGWHQERNGNNSTAEKYYRKAALGGDGHACFHIGVFAERRSDFAEAEGWYRQAVELGDLGALNNLGVMLQKKGDLDGAEKCWREAFAEGDVNSAWNLGMLFLDRGKQADCWKWLQQAARKQHPMAMDAVKKIGDLDDWGVGSDFAP
ncbi:tetratricopeptide repeat protein [Streptomyces sp. NBC_00487]|uniref:tetratricopeptide repeat protein n=1 Tax=unclassified Streptomyces TaxID=2593676 RepID=UPI002E18C04E|nr:MULTISPECIES: tetratricopeptide repeat protein [unclassified Streptomyces]